MRPRLLDLFCGAGGAAVGYHRAGFEVVGVDIVQQPHYPFEFIQAEALTYPLAGFAVVHASPPCQSSTAMRTRWPTRPYANLIGLTRRHLRAGRSLYVIENVEGAALLAPARLCGSHFNLGAGGAQLRRHRLFESNFPILGTDCSHQLPTIGVYGHPGGSSKRDRAPRHSLAQWHEAMGIDWVCTTRELTEAIPPAYTEYIGKQLMAAILR